MRELIATYKARNGRALNVYMSGADDFSFERLENGRTVQVGYGFNAQGMADTIVRITYRAMIRERIEYKPTFLKGE